MRCALWVSLFYILLFCSSAIAQLGPMNMGDTMTTLMLAEKVQGAVESKNYVFIAIIGIMLVLQFAKVFLASKFPSLKKNTAQYSAFGGAGMGAMASMAMGGDAVQGAMGGLMAGNAASGLYSAILKPVVKKLRRGK